MKLDDGRAVAAAVPVITVATGAPREILALADGHGLRGGGYGGAENQHQYPIHQGSRFGGLANDTPEKSPMSTGRWQPHAQNVAEVVDIVREIVVDRQIEVPTDGFEAVIAFSGSIEVEDRPTLEMP